MSIFIPVSSQIYPYQPLAEPGTIRLLLIKPGTTEEIHCSLVDTTLYACRLELFDHYIALSYVWGDLTNPKTVSVDGVAVSVTANLHAALCDLRDESRVLRLWVDALCINQSDMVEKGVQVTMMGDIYATADRTIIHLGRPDNANDSALRNLELCFKELLVQDRESTQVESLHDEAMKSILSKPWFRRVWILQELVLSKGPLVQYGKYRVSWDEFCRFLGPIKKRGRTLETSTYQLVAEMQDLRERFDKNKGEIRMIDILFSRKGLGVTNPKDMAYAHKGLVLNAGNLDVDYSKSCAELYADISFRGMLDHANHGILSCVDDGPASSRLKELPSWCPDWSQALSISKLPQHSWAFEYDAWDFLIGAKKREPEIAKQIFRKGHALFSHRESRVLTCLGIQVAVVTHVSARLSGKSIGRTKQEYFSSRLVSLRKAWAELGFEKFAHEAVSPLAQSIRQQHVKSLRDLYLEIYTAWQTTINNELILPSLATSTPQKRRRNPPEHTYSQVEKFAFLSDERMIALGCWIFRDGQQSTGSESGPPHQMRHEKDEENPYLLHYESTIDLLIQYFLPGFDKGIVDGRVLAQTTPARNSVFLCPVATRVDDWIFNLLPMFHLKTIRHFVMRSKPGTDIWTKEIREEVSDKLKIDDYVSYSIIKGPYWRDSLPLVTCTLVGEAYGPTNMYRKYNRIEQPEWRRRSSESTMGQELFSSLYDLATAAGDGGLVEEEEILAIF